MRVEQLEIVQRPRPSVSGGDDVVDFPAALLLEVPSAASAPAPLLLEQDRVPPVQLRMTAQPHRPVAPIPVEGTLVPSHLDVPSDGCLVVPMQPGPLRGRKGPRALLAAPVFPGGPLP